MRSDLRVSSLLPLVLVCVLRASCAPAQAVGPEFRVNSYTTEKQQRPRIATNSSGNFVVAWMSTAQDGSGEGVFGQRYASTGAPLGTGFQVNTYTTGAQNLPSVAIDSGGSFVVVWQNATQDGSSYGIFGQRYGSAGAPLGAEFQVNTYTTDAQGYPSVASASGGNFVAVWQSDQFGGVFGQRFSSTGTPLGTEFLVSTYTTGGQSRPIVASDPGGNFVVVWQNGAQDGSIFGVFGQRYSSAGTPLGAGFLVNTYTTNGQFSASVASGPDGSFVVTWNSYTQDSSFFGVFGQRYSSSGGPLGGEFRLNTYTTGIQRSSSVASDSGGNFVALWQSDNQDGFKDGVFGQRYGSAGEPLGGEFRVNTYTTSYQNYPSVASSSGGSFVVVWQGDSQDGSLYGVFSQRYCPTLSSVTASVNGTTTVCTNSTGGTATVTEASGGLATHQWGYRTMSGGATTSIPGQTGTSYVINGANFPPAGGFFYLVCRTFPDCGVATFSNEVLIGVTSDMMTAPIVTPPSALTTTQTLCM